MMRLTVEDGMHEYRYGYEYSYKINTGSTISVKKVHASVNESYIHFWQSSSFSNQGCLVALHAPGVGMLVLVRRDTEMSEIIVTIG